MIINPGLGSKFASETHEMFKCCTFPKPSLATFTVEFIVYGQSWSHLREFMVGPKIFFSIVPVSLEMIFTLKCDHPHYSIYGLDLERVPIGTVDDSAALVGVRAGLSDEDVWLTKIEE